MLNSNTGFLQVTNAYKAIETVSDEDFRHFIDPSNIPAQIILAHFFLIEHEIAALAMWPIIKSFPFRTAITATWIQSVARKASAEYEPYLAWAVGYAESGKMRELSKSGLPSSKAELPGLMT